MTNRLIHEKSPYLLQHAGNPVDWYPWGTEAFEAAKKEDKPIFLSIGYATCHWCHVMERESFENVEVARAMNETFVNIKVDREERPEVDSVYMEFAQALMSSAGGWPLNVILTPDLKPIFAVTYLPPTPRRGMLGLLQFIGEIKQLWSGDKRVELVEQADRIVEVFSEIEPSKGGPLPTESLVRRSAELLYTLADPVYGGLKGEPKFPLSYHLDFLLSYGKSSGDSRAHFFVDLTLDHMQRGGIYDHLGGGFSRYAVDEKWHIPHFEKMLYDNALLAKAYANAWKVMQKPRFEEVSRSILDYILREMTSEEGVFYSAQDADSEGHEGLFYAWTEAEILAALPADQAEVFCRFYSVKKEGDFEGKNILYAELSPEEFSGKYSIPLGDLQQKLSAAQAILLIKRQQRPPPFKDDKILSSWNGLLIDALVCCGTAFGEPRYLEAALKAADFLRTHLWKEGKLLRRFREKEARFAAGLDEYAFLIKGILSLFEANQGTRWLKWAMEMTEILARDFKAQEGAFYPTDGKEPLLIRKCEFYDGAEPSGNGVHADNLLRLYQITQDEKYLTAAEDILKASKSFTEAYPPGACYYLLALQRYLDTKGTRFVVALDEKKTSEKEIFKHMGRHFCPHSVFIWKNTQDKDLIFLLPNVSDKDPVDGQTAVYLCKQDHCEPPLVNQIEILKVLEENS